MRKKVLKKMLLAVLIAASFLSISPDEAYAATSPSYSNLKASSVTFNDATITATLKNPSKLKLMEAGFYIGEETGKAIEEGTLKYDKISSKWQKAESLPCSYDLKDEYGLKLKADKKYYIVLYATDSANNTYYSEEISFTTAKGIQYKDIKTKSVSSNNAVITATISNPSGVKIAKGGFVVMSESGVALKNGTKTDNVTGKWQTAKSVPCSYDLKNEYEFVLEAGKTYKIQLFCIDSSGNRYESEAITIETPKAKSGSHKTGTKFAQNSDFPFYYNASKETQAFAGQNSFAACYINSYAMVFQMLGNEDATPAAIYEFNGNTVSCKGTSDIAKNFGFKAVRADKLSEYSDFKMLSASKQEALLREALSKHKICNLNLFSSKTGNQIHMAIAYINNNGELLVRDPGDSPERGCDISYSDFLALAQENYDKSAYVYNFWYYIAE